MSGDINVSGFAYISNYLTVVGKLNANSDIVMTSSKILYTNNIYGYSIGYQSKIDLDNRFIDINNSSIDIIGKYIGFPHPSQTLTTTSNYMYIKPLTTGDFEMRLLNVPNTVITTDLANLDIRSQFSWNWYSTTGVRMAFIDPNASGVAPIVRFYGTTNQYIYYNAANNFGSYNSSTSTTIWSINSSGTISTSGSISGDAITGSSLNAGIITGGDITGDTIISNGTIYASDTITTNRGIISIGAITTVGNTGTITATGNGSIDSTNGDVLPGGGVILGKGIKSTGVIYASGAITAEGAIITRGGIIVEQDIIVNGDINGYSNIQLSNTSLIYCNLLFGASSASFLNKIHLDGRITEGGVISSTDIISLYSSFIHPSQPIAISSNFFYIKPISNGNTYFKTNNIGTYILLTDWATTTVNSQWKWAFKNGANTSILLDPVTTSNNRMQIYGVAGGAKYLYYNTSDILGLYSGSSTIWSIDGTSGNITTNGQITVDSGIKSNSIGPATETIFNINPTTEINFLKENGVSRTKIFTNATLDIMIIYVTGDNALQDGYWFWNKDGVCGFYKGYVRWYADTDGNMRCNNIICNKITATTTNFSDVRIKTNIIDINDISALAIIRQIQPKIYNYIDVINKGDKPVWGFIAQQVKSVLDYSTSLITSIIPDIYELAEVLNSNTIKLNTKTTINFEINKIIRLIKTDGQPLETKITSILDINTFTVKENIFQQQIFVYGREVDDFHTLNKDAIFTVATAALQEVDKELQSEKSLRQLLETRLLDLENKFINLGNQFLDLKNINTDLVNRIIDLENKITV